MLLPWDLKFALAAMPTLCGVREREAPSANARRDIRP